MRPHRPTVVISGASGGIGKVIARHFHVKNFHLLLLTGSSETAINLRKEVLTWRNSYACASHQRKSELPRTLVIGVDLFQPLTSSWNRTKRMLSDGCDLLITCHGAAPCIKPTIEVSEEDWYRVLTTDLTGTWRLCKAVAPFMLSSGHGGSMVIVSSFHAIGSYPHRAPYAAAKAGLCGLARALACEWGQEGIRVNVIAPGQVHNERTVTIAKSAGEGVYKNMLERAPSGQMVMPHEIAHTAEWLFENEGINGQTIVIDHGVTASLWHQPYPVKKDFE